MIRIAIAALCLGLGFGLTATADEKETKEKTLKGTVCCAKCELALKDAKKCATVIKVKDGDKEVIYYFDAASDKKFHADICKTPMEGTVTGTVSKEGKKMVIKATKVEYK